MRFLIGSLNNKINIRNSAPGPNSILAGVGLNGWGGGEERR